MHFLEIPSLQAVTRNMYYSDANSLVTKLSDVTRLCKHLATGLVHTIDRQEDGSLAMRDKAEEDCVLSRGRLIPACITNASSQPAAFTAMHQQLVAALLYEGPGKAAVEDGE